MKLNRAIKLQLVLIIDQDLKQNVIYLHIIKQISDTLYFKIDTWIIIDLKGSSIMKNTAKYTSSPSLGNYFPNLIL